MYHNNSNEVLFSQIDIGSLTDVLSQKVLAGLSPILTAAVKPQPKDEYITRNEAAKKLRVSLVTLGQWTKEGKIRGYRIGSRIRYKNSELETSLSKIQTR